MNTVYLQGHLGNDPELRFTTAGKPVCNFRVATNENYTDKDGQKQTVTQWHRVVVWGKQAENCAKFLKKGSNPTICGSLRNREWTDKEGIKRYTTEVVVSPFQRVEFGSRRVGETAPVKDENPPVEDLEIPF